MAKREKKHRTWFGRMMVFVLSVMAVIGVVAMALSVADAYINPQKFIWSTLFGLAFWEILAYNVAVFLLLLLFWSNKVWIAVVALAISLPGLAKSFAFGSEEKADDSFRVMSYNVHYFGHVDGETKREDCANQMMEMIRQKNPDILCCQEFHAFTNKVTRQQCIVDFAKSIGFSYIYYNRKDNYGGNVIFSKYPITKVAEDSGFGQENTYGVMVEVDAGEKGKFHVACVHLLSFSITDNEIDVLTGKTDPLDNLDTLGKSVLYKLSHGFQRRSDELQAVLKGMPPVGGPIIVCGDFNETPLSYNYRQMQKAGFVDTFLKAGRGIKPTYAGRLPLLRIDYIWGNEGIRPLAFERYKYKASDHFPIILDFAIQ